MDPPDPRMLTEKSTADVNSVEDTESGSAIVLEEITALEEADTVASGMEGDGDQMEV